MSVLVVVMNRKICIKVKNLQKRPQYAQRTPEWFLQRKTRITASEVANCLVYSENHCKAYLQEFPSSAPVIKLNGKCINSYQSLDEYIIQKCTNNPFRDNVSTLHGKKFEDIACSFYGRLMNKDVYEFGLINHASYKWLAASPDGITHDGIMLEIKCPNKRKIIDNYIPLMYWIQMQIQMEVCNLDECHFLECEITEITGEEYFKAPSEMKGLLCNFVETGQYIYPPNDIYKFSDLLVWADSLETHFGYHIEIHYYIITKYQIVTTKRSKEWFKTVRDDIKKIYKIITDYQNNPDKFKKFQEGYLTKKNEKFMNKFNSTICSI